MTIHALGPFRLDTQHDLLFRGAEPLALGRRAIALLRALVEQPGAVVAKDALIEAAWPGQAVQESNLTVQIAGLRRALGEVADGNRGIKAMRRAEAIASRRHCAMQPTPAYDAQETVSMVTRVDPPSIISGVRRGRREEQFRLRTDVRGVNGLG